MLIRDSRNLLSGVDASFTPLVQKLARRVAQALGSGYGVLVYEGYRSMDVQAAYYAKGREPIERVNELMLAAGLQRIKASENKIITYARPGQSAHQYRAAIDVCLLVNGKPSWANEQFWKMVGEVVRGEKDFVWGGDWNRNGRTDDERFIDKPHIELSWWRDVRDGKRQIETNV